MVVCLGWYTCFRTNGPQKENAIKKGIGGRFAFQLKNILAFYIHASKANFKQQLISTLCF